MRLNLIVILLGAVFLEFSAAAQADNSNLIKGRIGDGSVTGAKVFICDAKSGIALTSKSGQLFTKEPAPFLTATSDQSGQFQFTNLPPGTYRLIAESFEQTNRLYRAKDDVFDLPPTERVIIHGIAENIQVPSESAANVVIKPVGSGSITLDQNFPNNGGYVLFSTKPVTGDPILGFLGWNDAFLTGVIGLGCIPIGTKITVIGLPQQNVQAAIFVNDDSPGFGAAFYSTLPEQAQRIPIVAGWSDAQHEPPARIKHIIEVREAHKGTNYLKIPKPSSANRMESMAELKRAIGSLDRQVDLPNGEKATIAEIYAAYLYKQLLQRQNKR